MNWGWRRSRSIWGEAEGDWLWERAVQAVCWSGAVLCRIGFGLGHLAAAVGTTPVAIYPSRSDRVCRLAIVSW